MGEYVEEKGTVKGAFQLNGCLLGPATVEYSFHGQSQATIVPETSYVNPAIKTEHLYCVLTDQAQWKEYQQFIQRSNRNMITLDTDTGDELFWQHCEIAAEEKGNELHLKVLSVSHP